MESKSPKDMKHKAVCGNDGKIDGEREEKREGGALSSLCLAKVSPGPRKKLLVLSLGGFLCDRINLKDGTRSFPSHRSPDAVYGSYFVYKRPYCEEFLQFCREKFEVAIWSTAREWYTNSALDCMALGLRSKFLFVWNQDACKDSGFSTLHKKDKPIFLKELKKVWDLQCYKGRFSSSNTLMIEDEPYKCLLNPPNTGIFLTEYRVEDVNDTALGPKGQLRRYLDGLVADAADVPSYVKAHPFGQPAITAGHPEWAYYSEIIRRNKI